MPFSAGQKFCIWMIVLGCLALCVGSLAPFWTTSKDGLWFHCNLKCGTYLTWLKQPNDDITDFLVLHITAGLATVLSFVLMFSGMCSVCAKSNAVSCLVILAIISGGLGITGSVYFLFDNTDEILKINGTGMLLAYWERGWAYYMYFAGSCLITFFGFVLPCMPKETTNRVRPH